MLMFSIHPACDYAGGELDYATDSSVPGDIMKNSINYMDFAMGILYNSPMHKAGLAVFA